MSAIFEKSLIETPDLALNCEGLSDEVAVLCSGSTLSVYESDKSRLDWIDAVKAYQAQGLNLVLLGLSWNELSIASTVFTSAYCTVWSQVDKEQFVLDAPTIIAVTHGEQASVSQMEKLLDLVHASSHPVKILAYMHSNREMLPASMNQTPAMGDLERVLAAQTAIASAKKIDQETQSVASTAPRNRRI